MNSERPAVTHSVSEALSSSSLDTYFKRMSLRRRKRSLVYKRTCAGLTQEMEVRFDLRPSYEPTALAHLLPEVRVTCEAVAPVIEAMTSKHRSARAFSGEVGGLLLRQQINNLAAIDDRTQYWFLSNLDRASDCITTMKAFIVTWTAPFLEEYASLDSLVTGYERLDQRLPNDLRFYLYIAACYVLLQSPRRASAVLERHFGRPGPRKDYSQAFHYVSTLIH